MRERRLTPLQLTLLCWAEIPGMVRRRRVLDWVRTYAGARREWTERFVLPETLEMTLRERRFDDQVRAMRRRGYLRVRRGVAELTSRGSEVLREARNAPQGT